MPDFRFESQSKIGASKVDTKYYKPTHLRALKGLKLNPSSPIRTYLCMTHALVPDCQI